MKRWLVMGCCWSAVWVLSRADDVIFSKTVRPQDFSAAGLTKLSAEELARLDELVRNFKRGDRSAEQAHAAQAEADARERAAHAEAAKEKKSEGGILAKAKIRLTPGAEVEYAAIESRIVGNFTGWEDKTIFTLENGQRWQLANPGSYYTPALAGPKVKIAPAALGGFWMNIEGVNQSVRVVLVGGRK